MAPCNPQNQVALLNIPWTLENNILSYNFDKTISSFKSILDISTIYRSHDKAMDDRKDLGAIIDFKIRSLREFDRSSTKAR